MIDTKYFYCSNKSSENFKQQALNDINKFIKDNNIQKDDILEFKTNSVWEGGLRYFEATISYWK